MKATSNGHGKPKIQADCQDLERVTAEAWSAIYAANKPAYLFRYAGLAARIESDDTGEPVVRLINENRMRHALARVARWTKTKSRGGESFEADAMPPIDVVRD